ncbi:Pumilio like protein 2 [Cucumispora dikerogammari]|nr:Pumilio like protein 2 [Cucumispora dikerogammari]
MTLKENKEKQNLLQKTCLICKFFNNEPESKENLKILNFQNKRYGCIHKPLTINEKILLKSPNSTISNVESKIKTFKFPIGTQDINLINYIEDNEFQNMLLIHIPNINNLIQKPNINNLTEVSNINNLNLIEISKKMLMDQICSKNLQNFLDILITKSKIESERVNLKIYNYYLQSSNTLNKYQKEIFWFANLLKPNLMELTNDPYGNYVIQKLLEVKYLHEFFIDTLFKNNIVELSKKPYSCRVVQKAIIHFENSNFIFLELFSSINNLVTIQSSNHVIQKMIDKVIETSDNKILIKLIIYIIRNLIYLSNDKYGCRILQKMLDILKNQDLKLIFFNQKISKLLKTFSYYILQNIEKLSTDQYGNYVIQHALSLELNIKDTIIKYMLTDIIKYSKQKFASNIIEKIIQAKEIKYMPLLKSKFLECIDGKPCIYILAKDKYGNYVIQQFYKILDFNERIEFNNILKKHVIELKGNVYSKHLINKMLNEI